MSVSSRYPVAPADDTAAPSGPNPVRARVCVRGPVAPGLRVLTVPRCDFKSCSSSSTRSCPTWFRLEIQS